MYHRRKSLLHKFIEVMMLLAAFGAPLAIGAREYFHRPLGPSLALDSPTPRTSQPPAAAGLPTATPPSGSAYASAPAKEPMCGGPRVMNILAIGSDYRYNTYLYGLSDVIKIVRVDFVTPSMMVMDLPRDLYVEIPDISQHGGITRGKLNQPFLYGNPGLGYYDGPGEGPGLLARTLELNYGERPDHYIAVNMEVFVKIIDAVGGVDVDLPTWVLGHSPGLHHMNGTQALEFSRARPNGTFERTRQQDYVLAALWNKLRDPSVISHAGSLIAAFQDSVETDFSAAEIEQLVCIAGKLPEENVRMLDWPDGMFQGTRVNDPVLGYTFIWAVDNGLMRAYVAAFNEGQWPNVALTSNGTLSNPAAKIP